MEDVKHLHNSSNIVAAYVREASQMLGSESDLHDSEAFQCLCKVVTCLHTAH